MICRLVFLLLLPVLLLLCGFGAHRYAQAKGLFEDLPTPTLAFDRYSLAKGDAWGRRFAFQEEKDYNSIPATIVGTRENFLAVRSGGRDFLVEYDAEIDVELIVGVREVREAGQAGSEGGQYLVVQYDRFAELVFFEGGEGALEAEICLELPIAAADNALYHSDPRGNVWIATASMNKVLLLQLYSCRQRTLLAEFRHILAEGQNIHQLARIKRRQECITVEVVTYKLDLVELQVCPYENTKSVKERMVRPSHTMTHEEVHTSDFGVVTGNQNAFSEELERIGQYLLSWVRLSPSASLLFDRPPSADEHRKEQFDAIVVDEPSHCLINFSRNQSCTGVVALDRFLLNAKHPLFHANPHYHKHDLLQVLDREYRKETTPDFDHRSIVPGLNTTRRAAYKAAFRTFPDFKVEHLGVTSKVIVFHPHERLEEKDYSVVRTHEGGLVSEGIRFKGSFDGLPAQYEEVHQRVDAKPQEVIPGVFEAHMGYAHLMTYLHRARDRPEFHRVELLNMLGGKPVAAHYLRSKEGYHYLATTLLNNEWWVLEYSPALRRSIATKYELYVNASAPAQILTLKREYGTIGSEEHRNGEDDLAALMAEFEQQHGGGFVLLSIYRCIDEYYYVEFTDTAGSVFGVARIHFKNLSNRRIRNSRKYSGLFERMMVLEEKDMIPEKYSRKPYAVYIRNTHILGHLPRMMEGNNDGKRVWHSYCEDREGGTTFRKLEKLGSFHYFPISHFAIGKYGCDHASGTPHSEQFYAFNLRSMIIDGKQQADARRELRKEIITWILGGVATYITFAVVSWAVIIAGRREKTKERTINEAKVKTSDKTKEGASDKTKEGTERKTKKD